MKFFFLFLFVLFGATSMAQQRDTLYIDRGNGSVEVATVNPASGLAKKLRDDSTIAAALRGRDSLAVESQRRTDSVRNLARFARQEQRRADSVHIDSLTQAFTAAMIRLRLIQDSLAHGTDSSDIVIAANNDSLRRAFTQWKLDSVTRYAAIYQKIKADSLGLAALASGNACALINLVQRYMVDSTGTWAKMKADSSLLAQQITVASAAAAQAANLGSSLNTQVQVLQAQQISAGAAGTAGLTTLTNRFTADSAGTWIKIRADSSALAGLARLDSTVLAGATRLDSGVLAAKVRSDSSIHATKIRLDSIALAQQNAAMANSLANYQTIAALNATLAAYSTTSAMNTAITGALSAYSTTSAVNALLANYLTTTTAAATYATKSQRVTDSINNAQAHANFATTTQLNSALAGYVTGTQHATDMALKAAKSTVDSISAILARVGDTVYVYNAAGVRVPKVWKERDITIAPTTGNNFTYSIAALGYTYLNPVQVTLRQTSNTASDFVNVVVVSESATSLVFNLRSIMGAVVAVTPAAFTTNLTGLSLNIHLIGY